MNIRFIISLCSLLLCLGCYTFNGINLHPDLKTFTVIPFENQAPNAIPTLNNTFQESLKRRVINETKLSYAAANGDVEFSGAIIGYSVSPVAPQPGEIAQFSRLDITVQVSYFNPMEEEQNFNSSFTRFADFESSTNLTTVQDNLIEDINSQIIDDIFNRAFTNW